VPLTAELHTNSRKNKSVSNLGSHPYVACFLLLVICFLAASCKFPGQNAGLSSASIHSITREFAAAARKVSPPGTVIRMKLNATSNERELPDWLEVTLFSQANPPESAAQATRILDKLAEIAQRHKLQSGKRYIKEGDFSAAFQLDSRLTHFVEIRLVAPGKPARQKTSNVALPRLAIILDDLGSDRAAAESIFAMPYPLTISVLPNHEHSREIANEALLRGYQVMLHLPMQSLANESPEKEELRPGMSSAEVQKLLGEMVDSVPNAVGVNNHQGSQATADPALMHELMPAVRNLNLFYVDSRTTAATVAFDTAKRDGVPTAFRNVPFLDDVQEASAVQKQLQLALRGAKEKKAAIAIGHPHPATLEALRSFLPSAQENGVQLVFVSELVR
jgi:polysaccharide deacetylase 2 family uncharacterized protein YibQ